MCKTGKFEYPAEDEKCPDWEKCVLGNEDEFAFDLLGKGMKPFKSPEERNNKYSGLGIGFDWSANQKATLVQIRLKNYTKVLLISNRTKLNAMRKLITLEMMPERCVGWIVDAKNPLDVAGCGRMDLKDIVFQKNHAQRH